VALARELSSAVGAWLLVDAVHSAAHFPWTRWRWTSIPPLLGYKFYGPHVGLLYTRHGSSIV